MRAHQPKGAVSANPPTTLVPPYDDAPLAGAIEQRARSTPDGLALFSEQETLTYSQLDRQANRLANLLIQHGLGPGDIAGVCLERGTRMVVAILAVLKTGAGYLPLDPDYPGERLRLMASSARPRLIMTQESLFGHWAGSDPPTLCIDQPIDLSCADAPTVRLDPSAAAYVIFTSGSTGLPKGVQISHQTAATHCQIAAQHYQLTDRDRGLLFSSMCFDSSVEELFAPLLVGAAVFIRGRDMWSAREFCAIVAQQQLSVLSLPTAYWHHLASAGHPLPDCLRLTAIGGEAAASEGARRWQRLTPAGSRLINTYGPTEGTVMATVFEVPRQWADGQFGASVPIGTALPGRDIYLLDAAGQPAALGEPGEIYIGGPLLADGYLHQPALTAERFVPDPFRPPGGRMYRTGDVARYRPDGQLEFVGRTDNQVKVRGFRVELGEIEAVLLRHAAVGEAVVAVRRGAQDDPRIVAYVVPNVDMAAFDRQAVQEWAMQQLPDYMLPSDYICLDRLPLTPNGKIDVRALPAPPVTASQGDVPPSTAVEMQLAQIWTSLLNVEQVSVTDNFFSLGGHSLLALRMVAEVEKTVGVELRLTSLWAEPTIRHLAGVIASQPSHVAAGGPVALAAGRGVPLFCVAPLDGNPFHYAELAQLLAGDHSVYGLRPPGLEDPSDRMQTVSALAGYYLTEVRRIQPSGPVALLGFSFGGCVAFEMAQQLARPGGPRGLVAIIDEGPEDWTTEQPGLDPRRVMHGLANVPPFLADYIRRRRNRRLGSIRYELSVLGKRLRVILRLRPANPLHQGVGELWDVSATPAGYREFLNTNYRAAQLYQARPYPGPVLFFRARVRGLFSLNDPLLGWPGYAAEIEDRVLPGSHGEVLHGRGTRILAGHLRSRLAQLNNGGMSLSA